MLVALASWDFGVAAFGNGLLWVAYNSVVSAVTGFICGGTFSAVLSITEGQRRFDQMSLPRFALWGAVGGGAVGALLTTVIGWGTPTLLANIAILGLMGAASAAGSLAVARASDDRELLDAGEDVARVGLTIEETRALLSDAGTPG